MTQQQALFDFMDTPSMNPAQQGPQAVEQTKAAAPTRASAGSTTRAAKRTGESSRSQSTHTITKTFRSAQAQPAQAHPAALATPAPLTLLADQTQPAAEPTPESVIDSLRRQVGCISQPRMLEAGSSHCEVFSSGSETIDQWLPHGGLHPAAITEWIAAQQSVATDTLSLIAASKRLQNVSRRPIMIVDCQGVFYPPAALALGIPAERMILVRPGNSRDALWSIAQGLRSGALAAVWANLPMRLDSQEARRLQLAAETGHTPGLFVRDFQARRQPSFADVQFYVASEPRTQSLDSEQTNPQQPLQQPAPTRVFDFETIRLTMDRARGGAGGQSGLFQIDATATLRLVSTLKTRRHETSTVHLAAQLANPKVAKRVSPKPAQRSAS